MALSDNLEAYYGFDTVPGLLVDWTANHRNVTNNNGVTTDTGMIGSGQSAKFVNASNMYLSRTDAIFGPGTGFSIAGWLKVNTNPAIEYELVNCSGDTGAIGWNLHAIPNGANYKLQGVFSTDGTAVSTTPTSPDLGPGNWYFFAMTWSNASGKSLFVNNGSALNASQSSVHDSSGTTPFIMGNDGRTAQVLALDGWLDGVGFWSRVLDPASEILALYNSGAGMNPISPPALSKSRRGLNIRTGCRGVRPSPLSI